MCKPEIITQVDRDFDKSFWQVSQETFRFLKLSGYELDEINSVKPP